MFFHARNLLSVFFVCFVLSTLGCGAKGPEVDQLKTWMESEQRKIPAPASLESVEILNTEPQDDGSVKLEVQAMRTLQTDLFVPATLSEAFTEYGYDPQAFDRAIETASGLRDPERNDPAVKVPEQSLPDDLKIYRRTASEGKAFTWKGTLIAKKSDSGWDYSDVQGQTEPALFDEETVTSNDVPREAVLVKSAADNSPIAKYVAKQKAYIQAVTDANQLMQARLEREQRELLTLIQSQDVFQTSLPVSNGPATKLHFRFVHQENDGELVTVLIEDASNVYHRATWKGALKLAEAPAPEAGSRFGFAGQRSKPDGWSILLTPVGGEDGFPLERGHKEIALGVTQGNQLAWLNRTSPLPLEKTSAAPLPDYSTYAAQVQKWTAPGQTWEGTVQYTTDNIARNIKLTFTQFRDGGNYARAIMETSVDDYAVAVFEGTVNTSPKGIYSWPIRLKWLTGKGVNLRNGHHVLPLISAPNTLNLTFSATGECFGKGNYLTLKLKPSKTIEDFDSAPDRWRNALQAGTRWSGTVIRGNNPAEKIALTVCEVMEEGRTYRMTIHNPDNPHQFRAFAATLNDSDKSVDAYAVVLEPKSIAAQRTRFGYSGYDDVYGVQQDSKHYLWLSADGKTLQGISGTKELLQLSREKELANALDSKSRAQDWQSACTMGTLYRGRLNNTKLKQTTDVEMRIRGVDSLGNVDVVLSVPKVPKSEVLFRGPLNFDKDKVQAFALVLQKQTPGIGDGSLIFGKSPKVELQFRLTDDGKGLVGMALHDEFLELERVIADKK